VDLSAPFSPERLDRVRVLSRETVVVSPTFCEAETITDHVADVFRVLPEATLLVVDDESQDGTADAVDALRARHPRLHLLRRKPPRSFTGSYKDGISWAVERGFSRVVSMDADGSHAPDFLPLLLDMSHDADLVVGSRYLYGVSVLNWPLRRVLLSAFASIYARLITGVPCDDLTSGFCCYRVDVLQRIGYRDIRSSGYAYQIEMKYRIWRASGQLAETNILFVERRKGTSKISSGRVLEGVARPFWCRLFLPGRPADPKVPIKRGWKSWHEWGAPL
jgi:dolichol-phosphate mannosyltransferase